MDKQRPLTSLNFSVRVDRSICTVWKIILADELLKCFTGTALPPEQNMIFCKAQKFTTVGALHCRGNYNSEHDQLQLVWSRL